MIVITAFYNAEEYIERCIGSIIGQNHSDFKCYLIDDMSTDSSVDKIKNMIEGDDRFELIINTNKKYKLKCNFRYRMELCSRGTSTRNNFYSYIRRFNFNKSRL